MRRLMKFTIPSLLVWVIINILIMPAAFGYHEENNVYSIVVFKEDNV